jgi:predicted  nucleic acid-binding Zn-ribbon protein
MIATILLGLYTLATIILIHYYEKRLQSYKGSMQDYKRAFNLSKNSSNDRHYTQLQLEQSTLKSQILEQGKTIIQLDADNTALKAQLEQYKLMISELKNGIHTGYPAPNIDWHKPTD